MRVRSPETLDALRFASDRITEHHRRHLPSSETYTDAAGVTLGHRWTAVESAGLYVPGGLASYPSSVLMNAIAKVAGVERLVMVVPSPRGAQSSRAGRSQARRRGRDLSGGRRAEHRRARLRHSTIRPVVKIVGPGNAYVAAAKRQVFGTVGIDSIAGPSEVLVIADRFNDPEWIAADLLAQAEHDTAAQSILLTDDAASQTRSKLPSSGNSRSFLSGISLRRAGATSARSSSSPRSKRPGHRRPDRCRTSRDRDTRSRRARRAHSQRRRAVPRRLHAGSDRRLRIRVQTTSCRRRAARVSRPASACSIS